MIRPVCIVNSYHDEELLCRFMDDFIDTLVFHVVLCCIMTAVVCFVVCLVILDRNSVVLTSDH